MKTIRFTKGKKLTLGLVIIILLAAVALALSMPRVATNASASNSDGYLQPNNTYAVRYHIQTDNKHTVTGDLDKFLHNASYTTHL